MSAKLVIQPAPVTWDAFVALPDEDRRELIDGVLMEVEVPSAAHERIVAEIVAELVLWKRRHGGLVLASGYKIRISETRGVMPDVQFYRAGRAVPDGALSDGAPDLAVEVISPSSVRYDRVKKLNYYLQVGISEYWLIDPRNGTLERFVLESGSYRLTHACDAGDVFRPDTSPGIEIDLAALFQALSGSEG